MCPRGSPSRAKTFKPPTKKCGLSIRIPSRIQSRVEISAAPFQKGRRSLEHKLIAWRRPKFRYQQTSLKRKLCSTPFDDFGPTRSFILQVVIRVTQLANARPLFLFARLSNLQIILVFKSFKGLRAGQN